MRRMRHIVDRRAGFAPPTLPDQLVFFGDPRLLCFFLSRPVCSSLVLLIRSIHEVRHFVCYRGLLAPLRHANDNPSPWVGLVFGFNSPSPTPFACFVVLQRSQGFPSSAIVRTCTPCS